MHTQKTGSFIVAGSNYGQGSSREHAALAPNYLGIRAIFAKSYARIHRSNLINFGILPLVFTDERAWQEIDQGDLLSIQGMARAIEKGMDITVENKTKNRRHLMK